jgi:class 3 adenylate cyclase
VASDCADWPLPENPTLACVAQALEAHGFAGELWDADWRLVYLTSEYRMLVSAGRRDATVGGRNEHILSPALFSARDDWPTGPTFESVRDSLHSWGAFVMSNAAGGRDGLLRIADPRLHSVLEELEPEPPPPAWSMRVDVKFGAETIGNDVLVLRLDDEGRRAGYTVVVKPELPAGVLGMLALGDARLFQRMTALLAPARRPAAILFGDLEASSPLAKRLSSPAYFSLVRRLAREADRAIVRAGGIVGKHAGDGVTAFFLVEDMGSESSAARACIEAMHHIREAARTAAERSRLEPAELLMRFGLHWAATLYVGRLMTSGRAEVTALGDDVNAAARIEACAGGGRALASKELLERLDQADAEPLGLNLADLSYTPLASLTTASEKARRDAPAIAVREL